MKIKTRTRAEVYQLWLAALRSRKYRQAKGRLRNEGSFCCLGVLCDLARKDGGHRWDGIYGESFMGNDYNLPKPVRRFLKLGNAGVRLAALNDDKGASFREIADYIEKTVMPAALGRP